VARRDLAKAAPLYSVRRASNMKGQDGCIVSVKNIIISQRRTSSSSRIKAAELDVSLLRRSNAFSWNWCPTRAPSAFWSARSAICARKSEAAGVEFIEENVADQGPAKKAETKEGLGQALATLCGLAVVLPILPQRGGMCERALPQTEGSPRLPIKGSS
jgi:hypothetical protein